VVDKEELIKQRCTWTKAIWLLFYELREELTVLDDDLVTGFKCFLLILEVFQFELLAFQDLSPGSRGWDSTQIYRPEDYLRAEGNPWSLRPQYRSEASICAQALTLRSQCVMQMQMQCSAILVMYFPKTFSSSSFSFV